MMRTKFLTWGGMLFALCGLLMVSSCKEDDEDNNSGAGAGTETPEVVDGTMKYAAFYGAVYRDNGADSDPAPFSGVKVTTGDQTTTTDANGYYQFDKVNTVNGRAVLKFEKQGYMTVVRSMPVQDNMRLDVTMKESETETFPSSAVKTLTLNTGNYSEKMIVDLPGDCYVTENGTAYSGSVTAEAVYLDPDDATFATQMPGDLAAVRNDQSAAQLISYGMVAVDLKGAGGEKLNLAPGQKATLSFPIPDRFKENPPTTIHLWSFNEETGLWEEEGVATLTGALYIGQVSHFSWHNLDSPELISTVKLTVKDSNGKLLVGVPVDIHGQRMYYTDKNGKLKFDIPCGADVNIRVPSEYYGNYAKGDATKEAKITVNLASGETKDITLTVEAACSIVSGKVTNTGAGSNVCSILLSYYHPDTWWQQTKSVVSDLEGNYLLYAPPGITGPAQLVVSFADGTNFVKDFTLTAEDQVVNITVNSESNVGIGVVTVKNEAKGIKSTYYLPTPEGKDYYETAVINGTHFSADLGSQDKGNIDWDKGETVDMISFNTNQYSTGQSRVEKATFFWMKEGGPHLRIEASDQPADITFKNGIYTVKMTDVDGILEDQMKNYDYVPVKVSVEFSVKPAPSTE